VSYSQIARRLSISVSTAHYRQSRYEQAGDRVPFFRVWVRMLCAAGLRIDEACRARRSDVDLIAKCLRVGHAKTPAGVRTVQLTPDRRSCSSRPARNGGRAYTGLVGVLRHRRDGTDVHSSSQSAVNFGRSCTSSPPFIAAMK